MNRDNYPRLADDDFRQTSAVDQGYNCFAWAVGDPSVFWDPHGDPYYWPLEVPRNCRVDTMILAFATEGFRLCETGDLETEYEKIALYVDDHGDVKHAARQLPTGAWTSKLGRMEDIEHKDWRALEGPKYGEVRYFMERARSRG